MFQAVTAVVLLVFKISVKALVRYLAENQHKEVLRDAMYGFGLDIGLLGLSLISGGIVAGMISGAMASVCLVVGVMGTAFSLIFYMSIYQPDRRIGVWKATALSGFSGMIPFVMALNGVVSR